MDIVAEGISRIFFRKNGDSNFFHAVRETNFEFGAGNITEIIGRSGSGKTTLINMLCGLLTPSEGRVLIGGRDLYQMDDQERSLFRNRHFGIIPQVQTGLSSLTVMENVLLPLAMYGRSGGKEEYAGQLLEELDILNLADVYSNELSGGELRRMSIARALAGRPDVIIADEPTGDLDAETTSIVLRCFRREADRGAAILIVTHDTEVRQYTDRVFPMDKGTLLPCSSVDQRSGGRGFSRGIP